MGFVARILLLVALASLIRLLGLSVAFAALGLLIAAAAVLVELVYEMIHREHSVDFSINTFNQVALPRSSVHFD